MIGIFGLRLGLASGTLIESRPSPTPEPSYTEEVEKNYTIRSNGHLRITNLRGNLTIQGWSQDRLKIKAIKRASGATRQESKKLISTVDFRFDSVGPDIELSAEYGSGLSIEERLRERQNPKTRMDMVVYAPEHMELRAWTSDHDLTVRGWNAPVDVRTTRGTIVLRDLRSETLAALCPECDIRAQNLRGNSRFLGGTGAITLDHLNGKQLYVETGSGPITLNQIEGEQLYVSKSGKLTGTGLLGRIEFHTVSAPVVWNDIFGFVSGRADSGDVNLSFKRWDFSGQALIESQKGSITLTLPPRFSGEVDLWSVSGKATIDFAYDPIAERTGYGPDPLNHIRGQISGGREVLRIFTQSGDIQIKKAL